MEVYVKKLNKEFNKIKKLGWVKSIRTGNGGIGRTFESLLGKEEENFEIPDFYGIEIKTKRSYSKSYTTLFCATPSGKQFREIERLKDCYGYPDSIIKNKYVLMNSVFCNSLCPIGISYFFKLKINYEKKKVFLCVYDKYERLLEDYVHWDFDELEQKLYRKLRILAFVDAHRKFINGEEYFKYYKIRFYKLKGFDEFLLLLEKGIIRVTFKISVFRSGKRVGQVHDHGTSFDIMEKDLSLLFDVYK